MGIMVGETYEPDHFPSSAGVGRRPSVEGMFGSHRCGTLPLEPPRRHRNIAVPRLLLEAFQLIIFSGPFAKPGSPKIGVRPVRVRRLGRISPNERRPFFDHLLLIFGFLYGI